MVRKDGREESVYESFDYNDMPTYPFDSVSTNPKPDAEKGVDGAWTGLLNLEAGDSLHFVCDVENSLPQNLKFANEVKTGEMCIPVRLAHGRFALWDRGARRLMRATSSRPQILRSHGRARSICGASSRA